MSELQKLIENTIKFYEMPEGLSIKIEDQIKLLVKKYGAPDNITEEIQLFLDSCLDSIISVILKKV